jgi:hypothetical protein
MAIHRIMRNGALYEVEDGERPRLKGSDPLETGKCTCNGSACEDVEIEFPGDGFIVRNVGRRRMEVGLQIVADDWECGRWTHFKLNPGEAKFYPTGGYCCPYEAKFY